MEAEREGEGKRGGEEDDKQEVGGVKGTYQNHTLTQLFITGCWHATYVLFLICLCVYTTLVKNMCTLYFVRCFLRKKTMDLIL